MFTIDVLFIWLLKYLVVTFSILGVATLLLRSLWQPVEKVSLIKITLSCLVVAFLISSIGWLPKIELAWLPPSEAQIEKVQQPVERMPTNHSTFTKPATHDFVAQPNSTQANLTPSSHQKTTSPDPDMLPVIQPSVPHERNTSESFWPAIIRYGKTFFAWAILIVSCVQLLYVATGYLITRRLLHKSKTLACHHNAKIRSALCNLAGTDISHVRIRSSHQVQVPIVHGVFAPCIILPSAMLDESFDSQQLDHCLAHEWKHIERSDLFTWGLASLLQPLLWMQPFYWTLLRELRVGQDQIADQFAAKKARQNVDYAATLVQFSKSYEATLMGALSMAGSKSNVYRRVEMLLNSKFPLAHASRRKVVLGLVALMTLGSFALASLQPVRASTGHFSPVTSKVQEDDKQDSKKEEKEQATEPVEYTGVVRDATTKEPIEGAVVTVRRENSNTRKIIEETKHTTNEQGEYTFSIPPEQQNQPYLYIELDVEHEIYCSKKGFGYSYSMILKNIELGEAPFYSETLLCIGEPIFGRLVDEKGTPMSGIKVSCYSAPPSEPGSMGMGSFDNTLSDSEGKFRMNYAEDGNSVLWIHPDQLAMKQMMTGIKRGDLGDIQLDKGYEVTGKIVDALGKAVPGVWVEIDDLDAQAEIQMPLATSMSRRAKTDDQGRYSMKPTRASNYRLKVSKSGPITDENGKDQWETVTLPGVFPTKRIEVKVFDQPQEFNIQGVPHVYVSGQFLNSKGEPTGGHMPTLFGKVNDDYMFFEAVKGDEKGQFSTMVPHGMQDARISFMTNEHSSLRIQIGDGDLMTDMRDIEIGTLEEDFDQITVYRYVAPIIQVKIVDENGEVLEDAKIGANYVGKESEAVMLVNGMQTTVFFEKQKDGYHRSSQLCPDAEFEYFAQLENYERVSGTITMKEKETKKVTLTMEKTAGTVTSGKASEPKMEDKDKR